MKKLTYLFVMALLVSGCATTSLITPKLALGMTKQEVLARCGNPYQSGAVQDKNGQVYEVLTYKEVLSQSVTGFGSYEPLKTYVYFADGKVTYYGGSPTMPTVAEVPNQQ